MTKEEAIEILTGITNNNFYGGEVQTACRMGIEALSSSLPSVLGEAAEESARRWRKNPGGSESRELFFQPHIRGFKAGVEWQAGQGITKEVVIGMATEEIFIKVSEQTLDELDLRPGDKVVVQIRKK